MAIQIKPLATTSPTCSVWKGGPAAFWSALSFLTASQPTEAVHRRLKDWSARVTSLWQGEPDSRLKQLKEWMVSNPALPCAGWDTLLHDQESQAIQHAAAESKTQLERVL